MLEYEVHVPVNLIQAIYNAIGNISSTSGRAVLDDTETLA